MIERYAKIIFPSSPEGGVIFLALVVLGIIYLLFFRGK